MKIGWIAVAVTALLAAGCGTDPGNQDDSGPFRPSVLDDPPVVLPPADVYVDGDISADATWSGVIRLLSPSTIQAGVTVDIDPGATFYGDANTALTVNGTLNVNGTTGAPVLFRSSSSTDWNGIVVNQGTLNADHVDVSNVYAFISCETGAQGCNLSNSYVHGIRYIGQYRSTGTITSSVLEQMANGGVSVQAGGDVTITNTYLRTSSNDMIVMNGGSVTVDYSYIGGAQYEHCGFHLSSGGGNGLTLTNSIVADNVFGFMLGGTTNAVIDGNNFINNSTTHLGDWGNNVNVSVTNNYFETALPSYNGPADPDYDPNEWDFTGSQTNTPYDHQVDVGAGGIGPDFAAP